jgi:hypothetical protein
MQTSAAMRRRSRIWQRGQQFAKFERLHHVVVGAAVEARDFCTIFSLTRL